MFSDFRDKLLADLRIMAIAVIGPLRVEDAADELDMLEFALGERKLRGIGGTGGRSVVSGTLFSPSDELRLRCSLIESCISAPAQSTPSICSRPLSRPT